MMQLSQPLLQELREAAERAYPAECCGFVLGLTEGADGIVKALLPAENDAERGEQYHRFEITPEQMLSAERYARTHALEILGFYHSHPDHPAIPSEYDRSHAMPVYRYPIVSVRQGTAAEVRCWVLDPQTGYQIFTEELIERGDEEHGH